MVPFSGRIIMAFKHLGGKRVRQSILENAGRLIITIHYRKEDALRVYPR